MTFKSLVNLSASDKYLCDIDGDVEAAKKLNKLQENGQLNRIVNDSTTKKNPLNTIKLSGGASGFCKF